MIQLFYSRILDMNKSGFIQEFSGAYTSTFLDMDELKIASRGRKVSGAFEKRAPGQYYRPDRSSSFAAFLQTGVFFFTSFPAKR